MECWFVQTRWLMRYCKWSGVVVLLVALFGISAYAGDFDIKFGLMKKNTAGQYYVYSETTTIPLIFKDDDADFRFGYSVRYSDDQTFTTYLVLHPPATFEKYSGDLRDADRNEGGKAIQTPPQTARSGFAYSFRFDRGDPPGQYKIDIWINDKLIRTIDFTVVEAK